MLSDSNNKAVWEDSLAALSSGFSQLPHSVPQVLGLSVGNKTMQNKGTAHHQGQVFACQPSVWQVPPAAHRPQPLGAQQFPVPLP